MMSRFSLALSFLILLAPLAQAGGAGTVGNGGVGVVCRNSAGKILSADLLDLYEAEHDPLLARSIIRKNLEPRLRAKEIWEMLRRIGGDEEYYTWANTLAIDLGYFYNENKLKFRPMRSPSVAPSMPRDFNPRVSLRSPGCRFEPIATYFENGIQLNGEILKELSPTDRAALYFHEALYAAARENKGVTDSDGVRLLVGQLFSLADADASQRAVLGDVLEWKHVIPVAAGHEGKDRQGRWVFRNPDSRNEFMLRLWVWGDTDDNDYRAAYRVDGASAPDGVGNANFVLLEGRLAGFPLPVAGVYSFSISKLWCNLPKQLVAVYSKGPTRNGHLFPQPLLDFSRTDRHDFTFVYRPLNPETWYL